MMRRLLICLLLTFSLSACEGLVQTEATRTPTKTAMPPLNATVTVNPLPPTQIGNDFSAGQFVGGNNPTAAAAPAESDLRPENTPMPEVRPELVMINTMNGSPLNAELYRPANLTAPAPAVLIVSTLFDDWGGFPVLLRDAGFIVLNVQSRVPLLAGDFDAMLDYLAADVSVNGDRIGVIGAENGADSAFIGCTEDARCKAVVLLTPQDRLALANVVPAFNTSPRPLLIGVSQDNPDAARTAQDFRQSLSGDDITLQPFDAAGRGTQILTNRPDMGDLIIVWLTRYLVER